jgi:hypothetical protein
MSQRSRLDRLARTIPCPLCAGRPTATTYRWLEPGEEPGSSEPAPDGRCEACGRPLSGGVVYIGWMSSEPGEPHRPVGRGPLSNAATV